jgi:hypothetical protein
MTKALDAKVTISENGKLRNISMREAIVKRAVAKAASGDFRSIRILLLDQIPRVEDAQAATFEPTPLSPAIGDLFRGAFEIMGEHGALPAKLQRAYEIANVHVPLENQVAPTIPPASGANANHIQTKKVQVQEDPPF